MVTIPANVLELARRPDSCKILSTINEDGTPHSIVCGTLFVPDEETIGVGQVWLNTTGKNIARDPRAEVLLWEGAHAYSLQLTFRKRSEEPAFINSMNEKLERMNVKVTSVWFFDIVSVTDEGFGPNVGTQIV